MKGDIINSGTQIEVIRDLDNSNFYDKQNEDGEFLIIRVRNMRLEIFTPNTGNGQLVESFSVVEIPDVAGNTIIEKAETVNGFVFSAAASGIFTGTTAVVDAGNGVVPDDGVPATGKRILFDSGSWGTAFDIIIDNIITPATLVATANDYNPAGFATASMLRQDVDADKREITGFEAPPIGVNRIFGVSNINTSGFDIKYKHNNAGSVAGNRILLRDDADKDSKPNETALFWYDHTSLRWRPFNRIG